MVFGIFWRKLTKLNNMKSKIIVLLLLLPLLLFQRQNCLAEMPIADSSVYSIYSSDGFFLAQKQEPQVGDQLIMPTLEKYEVVAIDQANLLAHANKIGHFEVNRQNLIGGEAPKFKNAKVAMYMTHNAESYELGDGYSSIYGPGGIHDVAKQLAQAFQNMNVGVVLDQTLHIPHDAAAYTRSGVTAQRLLNNYSPNALFDIHRDGVPRSLYYTTHNGVPRSKIRMVVGKASTNFAAIQNLAVILMANGNQLYPWLFLDIYLATGHYNQGRTKNAMLFEMGTYLIEKHLVMASCAPLAEVVALTMFERDLSNGGIPATEIVQPTPYTPPTSGTFVRIVGFVSLAFCAVIVIVNIKPKRTKKNGMVFLSRKGKKPN